MNLSTNLNGLKLKSAYSIDPLLLNAVATSNLLCFSEIVGIFGIIGNVVNIINFKKQGYKDGANVTFTALSISDLGYLVTQQIYIHVMNPWTNEADFIMLKKDMPLLVVYLSEYFLRVSGFITSFAAFERCLCVVLPMKVKIFVNAKVSLIINTGIFVFFLSGLILPYCLIYIDWKYVPAINKTILYVYLRENRASIINIYYIVAGLFLQYITITMLIVFTIILVTKLKTNSLWRQQACQADDSQASIRRPYKERKAISMLIAVLVIYIVCLIPHSALNTTLSMVPEMKIDGPCFDVTILFYCFTTVLETVNCSVPVLVYYRRSTRYREVMFIMFAFLKKKDRLERQDNF